ncbi:hypothetical protein THF1C08_150001 [Vibrio jasicida]|uniref:Uncharacterized protein n=1 Tax=Vibrio jasicida TaxID=766224 RepID=A0AAU9QJ20_9VIBR|nr:hypothetical protein THF1C08_150001 [Vibrio jasicida]CAH1577639.1 hypothetical protein THF1A12_150002 [Vibrio jasicida]
MKTEQVALSPSFYNGDNPKLNLLNLRYKKAQAFCLGFLYLAA